MDEPLWMLWVAGLFLIVGGFLLFIHRDRAAKLIRRSNPLMGEKDILPPEGSFLILPAIMAPPMGVFFLFYAAHRTFGWWGG